MLIAPVFLAVAAVAQASSPERQRSRDEVLALPIAEAAGALLGDIAGRFVSMTVARNGDVPVEVAFATAPEGTGLPGLCRATALRVTLVRNEDRGARAVVRGYAIDEVYKVVGEVDGPLGPLEPNEGEQARTCAAAGPVLAEPSEGERAPRFFSHRGNAAYWLGVAALQGAIRQARERRFGAIECTRREPGDCDEPQADLASLDLRDLADIEVLRTEPHSVDYLVRASFVAEPGRHSSFGWRVSLEFNGEPLPVRRMRRATFVYGRTQLYRY